MKAVVKLLVCGVVATPVMAIAQEAKDTESQNQAGLSCIKDTLYSREFLTKYPRAPAACREVVMRDGQKWIRFEAEVVSVTGNDVNANFIDEFDQVVANLTFAAQPDARVVVDGREMKYSALQKGDTLTFWMSENRFGFYGSPNDNPGDKLAVVSSESPPLR
jgi:hypothetical protein